MAASAIVIGAGGERGTGASACRRFAREGLHVFAAARSVDRLEALAEEIRAAGGACTPVPTDATDPAQIEALFERASETGPPRAGALQRGPPGLAPTGRDG